MKDKIYGEFEEHVKTGDVVWCAGDLIDYAKQIIVGPSYHSEEWRTRIREKGCLDSHCYEAVNAHWGTVYFDNQEDARRVTREYRAGYTDWLFSNSWRT